MQQVASFRKLEDKKLPEDFDYSEVNSLRREAVQKLNKVTAGYHWTGIPYIRCIHRQTYLFCWCILQESSERV